MGVRLTHLLDKQRETEVEYDDETVAFAYHPHRFTMELSDRIDKAAEDGDQNLVAMLLSPLLVWWDVLDDEDQRIEPSVENMKRFPMRFLNAVMGQINKDQAPEQEG